jgi:hypothetical protein
MDAHSVQIFRKPLYSFGTTMASLFDGAYAFQKRQHASVLHDVEAAYFIGQSPSSLQVEPSPSSKYGTMQKLTLPPPACGNQCLDNVTLRVRRRNRVLQGTVLWLSVLLMVLLYVGVAAGAYTYTYGLTHSDR